MRLVVAAGFLGLIASSLAVPTPGEIPARPDVVEVRPGNPFPPASCKMMDGCIRETWEVTNEPSGARIAGVLWLGEWRGVLNFVIPGAERVNDPTLVGNEVQTADDSHLFFDLAYRFPRDGWYEGAASFEDPARAHMFGNHAKICIEAENGRAAFRWSCEPFENGSVGTSGPPFNHSSEPAPGRGP